MGQNHLTLNDREVHLWFTFTDSVEVASLDHRYKTLLSFDELESFKRLQQEEHKTEYLVSHALLRSCLSQYIDKAPQDWQFVRNNYGKPSVLIDDSPINLKFNLAHTKGLAVCAVSRDYELGVDVEYHSDPQAMLEMADHYFSETEINYMNRLPKAEQEKLFFRYWTLKEAYIKAKGQGLTDNLSTNFSFDFSDLNGVIFRPPVTESADEASNWSFHYCFPTERYTASVAVNVPHSNVRCFNAIPDNCYSDFKIDTSC